MQRKSMTAGVARQLQEMAERLRKLESAVDSLLVCVDLRAGADGGVTGHGPLRKLAERLRSQRVEESPAPPWKHLVQRAHPWRRQLYLKGRNLTVRQLVNSMSVNRHTAAKAAKEFELPLQAVREALEYAEENQALLNYETAFERLLLEQKGQPLGARALPR